MNITSIVFNRLDAMRFSLTTPAPYDLSMVMASDGVMDVTVGVTVVLSSSWGPTLAMNLTMTLRATRANLNMAMWLSVNEAAIRAAKLFTDLIASPSCPPLNDLAVKGLAVSFETAFMRMDLDPSSSALQKDFFNVLNNANLFVVSALKGKLAPLLSVLIATTGREYMNKTAHRKLNVRAARGTANCTEAGATRAAPQSESSRQHQRGAAAPDPAPTSRAS